MKPSRMIILLMFYGVTSALSGIEHFTPLVSYSLPGSGQLGAFSRYTIDRCAELCLKTRPCISFEFDLFYEICYLSKFNRSNYNLVTSKTRNYYELNTESKNLAEPNIQEGKNEEVQIEKGQNLADDKAKDKAVDSSIKEQSQNWENKFHVNSEQSSSKADASLSVNSPNLNPSGRLPENVKSSLNEHNVDAPGVFEDGKTKGSVGRNNEDFQHNLINDSVIRSNKQLPNLDRFGQEYKFQVNGPTSFDNSNQNLPSGVNTETNENGMVQESPHLTRQNFFPVESMGVTTAKKNPFEDGFRKVHNIQGRLPFLSKGQGEDEIMEARNERPSAVPNGNSRDFQISGNFYHGAPGELQDHTSSLYVPPIYPVPPECHLKPFHEDRRYYLEFVPGHGMRPRPCSAGTIYNHTRCQCVIGSVEVTECEPEFFLDFNYQIADKSRNGLPLTVFGVYPQQGAGVFNNDSHIKIWRFSDAHIGNKLTIHIKFKDTGSHRNRIEYLISNCYQDNRQKTSSVALALNWRTREVLMLVDTNKSEPKVLRLKYTPNQWENLTLNYDGEIIQAQLGQTVSERVPLQGEIEPRPSGFIVGNCGHFPSFTGLIQEVQIYLCNPRREKLMDRHYLDIVASELNSPVT
ncbi:uncharacterized protein LOC106874798 isoform X2 [Octopus bimaculoides]|uniref:Apple domain-containing protein n=2 Tax=Octopus bimaculoides TaxID=37653 RepID=A0A0L8GT95_OCTBM|nr:uncharacterized protein LOC106874798 isoform X2 [Octopus bimaculoides]XP_052829926.1 uncharacterized protein LOC106874798 isoform X2 [Octopus bimaculoides]XP_052829927.1 uncharacterized protein LOC106874798 isoform X2 [Octopus bimaculoides]|eukprot:XP_014778140.1 PREDICTED: uncharacterized protein LOC106874798 [Octopus bimaculoides]